MTHHRIQLPARFGSLPSAAATLILAGTVTATWWGILIGNVLRGGDLVRRPLRDFFSVNNGPGSTGGILGAVIFLVLSTQLATIRTGRGSPTEPDDEDD